MTSLLRDEVHGADRGLRLRDDHLMAGQRHRARNPQPDDTRSDNKDLHPPSPTCKRRPYGRRLL